MPWYQRSSLVAATVVDMTPLCFPAASPCNWPAF
jgi:hypothetical protein